MSGQLTSAEEWIAQDEGRRRLPYYCTEGKLSIGIGRNLEDRGLSEDEIDYLFRNDMKVARSALVNLLGVQRCVELQALWPARYAALLNMAFQLGWQSLGGFQKMLAAVKARRWDTAADECLDSKYAREDTPNDARRVAHALRFNEFPKWRDF